MAKDNNLLTKELFDETFAIAEESEEEKVRDREFLKTAICIEPDEDVLEMIRQIAYFQAKSMRDVARELVEQALGLLPPNETD